jgi:hypothetical protein
MRLASSASAGTSSASAGLMVSSTQLRRPTKIAQPSSARLKAR